jgi:hypothetical protein
MERTEAKRIRCTKEQRMYIRSKNKFKRRKFNEKTKTFYKGKKTFAC